MAKKLFDFGTKRICAKVAEKLVMKNPLGDLPVFLARYGSDCLTLYTIAFGDADSAVTEFKKDLYEFLKDVRLSKVPFGRDSFLQYILRRLPIPQGRGQNLKTGIFGHLSTELQIVSWLRDGMALHYSEIATVTGLPIKDITSKLQEARRIMGEAAANI